MSKSPNIGYVRTGPGNLTRVVFSRKRAYRHLWKTWGITLPPSFYTWLATGKRGSKYDLPGASRGGPVYQSESWRFARPFERMLKFVLDPTPFDE